MDIAVVRCVLTVVEYDCLLDVAVVRCVLTVVEYDCLMVKEMGLGCGMWGDCRTVRCV